MNDNQTPLPSSEYDCSDLANGEKTPTGICQHGACPAGSITLAVSECSDNWWDKTCCKFMVSPSATSLSGLTSNPTSNSSGGGTNINNSNVNNNSNSNNSNSAYTGGGTALPSQCTGGQTGGTQDGCSDNVSDTAVLAQCAKIYAGEADTCKSMQSYLTKMATECKSLKDMGSLGAQGVDCGTIAQGGIYGREASKFSSYLMGGSASGSSASGAGGLDFDSIAKTGIPDSPNVKVVLVNIVSWMLEILGLITFIAFIISGGQYLMASGNDKMIETAKKNMTYSIIGIIVALSGFVIIRAVDMALRATSRLF